MDVSAHRVWDRWTFLKTTQKVAFLAGVTIKFAAGRQR